MCQPTPGSSNSAFSGDRDRDWDQDWDRDRDRYWDRDWERDGERNQDHRRGRSRDLEARDRWPYARTPRSSTCTPRPDPARSPSLAPS